jgi:3',5'-cyclic-AMP phosphodiesterase
VTIDTVRLPIRSAKRRGRARFFARLTVPLVFCLQFSALSQRNEFYFVQITDTHWGDSDNVGRTKAAIDNINTLPMPIAFVVHTGDLTAGTMENGPFMDSVCAMMRTCKFPVYYLPGNHDIAWKRFRETSEAYVRHFGSLSRRIEAHGVSLITLFNIQIQSYTTGKLLNDPLRQLDSLLKDKPANMPAILFQHDPTVEDFYNNALHAGWPFEQEEKFQKLCEENNVVAIIAGHFHRDEFHWIGRIPLYIATPISRKWGRSLTYRVYHYENGMISYFTRFLQ